LDGLDNDQINGN